MYYLYTINNSKSDTFYVGVTRNPDNRMRCHRSQARKGEVKTKLYDAMRSYGLDNFELVVIATYNNVEDCYTSEAQVVEGLRGCGINIYNLAEGGKGGAILTDPVKIEAWKAKLRKARAGRKPALGMKHSEETKANAARVSQLYWETQETYTLESIVGLSFKQASETLGISKTHFYRLRKRATVSDCS